MTSFNLAFAVWRYFWVICAEELCLSFPDDSSPTLCSFRSRMSTCPRNWRRSRWASGIADHVGYGAFATLPSAVDGASRSNACAALLHLLGRNSDSAVPYPPHRPPASYQAYPWAPNSPSKAVLLCLAEQPSAHSSHCLPRLTMLPRIKAALTGQLSLLQTSPTLNNKSNIKYNGINGVRINTTLTGLIPISWLHWWQTAPPPDHQRYFLNELPFDHYGLARALESAIGYYATSSASSPPSTWKFLPL